MTQLSFCVFGAPVPKERARVVNGRAYTPARTAAYEKHVAAIATGALSHVSRWDPSGPFRLIVDVYRVANRGDLDNLVKSVSDSLNATAIWDDDRLVHEIHARMFVDKARPRVEVVVQRITEEEQREINVAGSRAVLGAIKERGR